MKYVRKTKDVWELYVNYGLGWEYETAHYTLAEAKENRRVYRENCRYPLRIVKRREAV